MESSAAQTDDEIDLLDLLVVIAENLKLLILGPLFVGICALGTAFTLPQTYESQSTLNPQKPGLNVSGAMLASYIKSFDVLKKAADDIGFEPDSSTQQRIEKLEKLLAVSVGKQDQLVTLKTQGDSPESARLLNESIWKNVLPLTIPRGKDMERLQTQIQAERERLQAGQKLEIETAKKLLSGSASASEATSRLYGELLAANSTRLQAIAALEAQAEGLTLENLTEQPTVPERAIKPKKALIAIAATLGAGMLLLFFVFVRHALRSSSKDPEQAAKLQQIRRALGFKS